MKLILVIITLITTQTSFAREGVFIGKCKTNLQEKVEDMFGIDLFRYVDKDHMSINWENMSKINYEANGTCDGNSKCDVIFRGAGTQSSVQYIFFEPSTLRFHDKEANYTQAIFEYTRNLMGGGIERAVYLNSHCQPEKIIISSDRDTTKLREITLTPKLCSKSYEELKAFYPFSTNHDSSEDFVRRIGTINFIANVQSMNGSNEIITKVNKLLNNKNSNDSVSFELALNLCMENFPYKSLRTKQTRKKVVTDKAKTVGVSTIIE